MKKIIIIIFLSLIICLKGTTITYNVTQTTYNNGSGSLYDVLYGSGAAVTMANSGSDVVINFNATGLVIVPFDLTLTLSTSGTGKVTFQKSSSATVDQGFINSGANVLWTIPATNSSRRVEFKSLKIKGFGWGIWTNGTGLTVQTCYFEDCPESIHLGGGTHQIEYNTFTESTGNTNVLGVGIHVYSISNNSTINNNVFVANNTSMNNYTGIHAYDGAPAYSNLNIHHNTFTNVSKGIYVRYAATITDNVFTGNITGVYFNDPLSVIINYNTFTNARSCDIHVIEWSSAYSTSFIGGSSNGSNVFNGTNQAIDYSTFIISGYGGTSTIAGLVLPGKITVDAALNIFIQENKITTDIKDVPINLINSGNWNITAPVISHAISVGNVLNISYYLNGSLHTSVNTPFTVEFFKCNSNGDLISFLGSQQINTAGASPISNNITLSSPFAPGEKLGMTVTLASSWSNSSATARGTSKVAYSGICSIPSVPAACVNKVLTFSTQGGCPTSINGYLWSFGDGSFGNGSTVSHSYASPGNYNLNLSLSSTNPPQNFNINSTVQVDLCNLIQECDNCIGSFAPDPGDYIVSLWVREATNPPPIAYNNAKIEVSFTGNSTVYTFGTDVNKNKVIDGWQKIEEPITIPSGVSNVNLKLINIATSGPDAFFDDIRIHPKNAQMKSYVYDPVTLKLSAIMDENNYATFYEYDEEGKLLRVKKETEKGIMTIQESRENLKKK
jgi:hypothetical protein